MKQLLTLAATILLVGQASAVSFQWTSGNTTALRVQFGAGNYVAATAYLVALNTGTNVEPWDIDGTDIGNTVLQDAAAGTNGRYSNTFQASMAQGEVNPGDKFGVYLVYTKKDAETGESTTYKNVMSYTFTLSQEADDTTTISAQTFGTSANYALAADGTALAAGSGWVKVAATPEVPEPATGALALAGVALLFKRRRA